MTNQILSMIIAIILWHRGNLKISSVCFFTWKKASRWYTVETITTADYTDDQVLLANKPAQAISLLHIFIIYDKNSYLKLQLLLVTRNHITICK